MPFISLAKVVRRDFRSEECLRDRLNYTRIVYMEFLCLPPTKPVPDSFYYDLLMEFLSATRRYFCHGDWEVTTATSLGLPDLITVIRWAFFVSIKRNTLTGCYLRVGIRTFPKANGVFKFTEGDIHTIIASLAAAAQLMFTGRAAREEADQALRMCSRCCISVQLY